MTSLFFVVFFSYSPSLFFPSSTFKCSHFWHFLPCTTSWCHLIQSHFFSLLGLHAQFLSTVSHNRWRVSFKALAEALIKYHVAAHFIEPPPLPNALFLLLKKIQVLHITVQLFALSFRKSVATVESSGLPGMCEIRFVALCDLFRFTFLFVLFTHAKVATWKMSLTLFSDCKAEHSMYVAAPICLAIFAP